MRTVSIHGVGDDAELCNVPPAGGDLAVQWHQRRMKETRSTIVAVGNVALLRLRPSVILIEPIASCDVQGSLDLSLLVMNSDQPVSTSIYWS